MGIAMRQVSNLEELDRILIECDAAAAISDDELRKMFASFSMSLLDKAPPDPFSEAYKTYQMQLYHRLAGKHYAPANEVSVFDLKEAAKRPFPFSTASPSTAGDHVMAVGVLLRNLKAPVNARIVEFGAGWGNTTIALATLGFDVTAVDIEARFCDLIGRR